MICHKITALNGLFSTKTTFLQQKKLPKTQIFTLIEPITAKYVSQNPLFVLLPPITAAQDFLQKSFYAFWLIPPFSWPIKTPAVHRQRHNVAGGRMFLSLVVRFWI